MYNQIKNKGFYISWVFCIWLCFNGCVEPYDIKSIKFESALVVEASITDENKTQIVKISKTIALDEHHLSVESNAQVQLIDNFQNSYNFYESEPGIYSSTNSFKAIEGREYQLKIRTAEGRSYSSEVTRLTAPSTIDNLYAEKTQDESGIAIYLDSYNEMGNARYYRYDYEETYKIEVPKFSYDKIVVESDTPPYKVSLEYTTEDNSTCYNTIYSKGIVQTETNNLSEDRISGFQVRFIDKDDFIISNRYSILVKQYVQSRESYAFYKALHELSESENLLSQNQPGFINGNLFAEEETDENVIGFCEIVTVATKRIFFNPTDILPEVSPPFISTCTFKAPLLVDKSGRSPLIEAIKSGKYQYYWENDQTLLEEVLEPGGPYLLVPVKCGDCTALGTIEVPDFWQD